MELSQRLQAVVDAVTPGLKAADIGCDHGFTSIYLVRHGICPYVYAMDVNKGPLERARNHVLQAGLENSISLRLSDGLDRLEPGEAESIIISGMGGLLIRDILNAGKDVLDAAKELVLSPQSECGQLRHFLHQHGFCITGEKMIKDTGKFYVVIKAVHGREYYEEEWEYTYGKLLVEKKSEVFTEWVHKELEQVQKIMCTLGSEDTLRSRERRKELMEKQRMLKCFLN